MIAPPLTGQTRESDAIYYRDGVTNPVSEWLMGRARRDLYALFLRELAPTSTTTILDIGVSTVEAVSSNALERFYPYQKMITCAGLGNGDEVKRQYPDVNYVPIEAGARLPFADQQFDIAYSNAVLEHVGGPSQRAMFVSEALRVAKAIFFTVPNCWFPVEHHTGIPALHYMPSLFRRMLAGGAKSYWSDPKNLDFLSKRLLRREFMVYGDVRLRYCGLWLGSWSSNIALILKRAD
jgi:SAM-dependent methyltransferase